MRPTDSPVRYPAIPARHVPRAVGETLQALGRGEVVVLYDTLRHRADLFVAAETRIPLRDGAPAEAHGAAILAVRDRRYRSRRSASGSSLPKKCTTSSSSAHVLHPYAETMMFVDCDDEAVPEPATDERRAS